MIGEDEIEEKVNPVGEIINVHTSVSFRVFRTKSDHVCLCTRLLHRCFGQLCFVLMPAAPECNPSHHGRIMKCVTFLLLLPETLKKLKRASKHPGRLSVCYNVLTLSLKKRMAAELYPVNDHATVPKNEMLSLSEKKKKNVEPVPNTATTIATTPTTEQNINNNNVEIPSWQCAHPTLRERQVKNEEKF